MEQKYNLYYDAMECLSEGDYKLANKLLCGAIKIDNEFIDGYVGLSAVYREEGKFLKEKEYADLAYEFVEQKYPKWPKKMEWGILENRPYMRAICNKASTSQISGDNVTAEKLYRLLLELNPNDNQGVRYLIAGMFAGLSPSDVDDLMDEGNEKQNWDKTENLVKKQNKLHKFWKLNKYINL